MEALMSTNQSIKNPNVSTLGAVKLSRFRGLLTSRNLFSLRFR